MSNLLKLTQNQTKEAIKVLLQSDVTPMIYGASGVGKSEIIRAVGDELNLEVIDLRLSQLLPMDLAGYPKVGDVHSELKPLSTFPLETTPLPQGKDGFLIFMDELNSGDKYVQGASYKLLTERMIGDYKLHPKTRIIAAGNRIEDVGLVNNLLTPVKTRLAHIEMVVNEKEFLEYVANQVTQGKWNPLILGFLNFMPEMISTFDPKTVVECTTVATPRTWFYLSQALNNNLLGLGEDTYSAVINGIIGDKAGTEFTNFLSVSSEIPDIADVLADPVNCVMSSNIGARWAMGAYFLKHINAQTVKPLVEYISRIPEQDIQVVVFRTLLMKYPNIVQEPKCIQVLSALKQLQVGIKP